jgi:hypothetical protein
MHFKIILTTLSAVFLTSSAVCALNCPSIPEHWDGKTLEASGSIKWSVGKLSLNKDVKLEDVDWQAYTGWILPENKPQYLKYGYFQCNYKAVDKKEPGKKSVGKMTIQSEQTDEFKALASTHQFQGGSGGVVVNDYKSGVKQGAKCIPDVGSPEGLNKFPAACEIVERPKKQ